AKVNRKKKNEIIALGALFIVSMVSVWIISSKQTDGYIDLRYANKDHLGREKGDITTGRKKLFQEELEGFISNPFFGIGSSRAKDQRIEVEGQGVTSHSEISRLLAEHGLLGVMIIVILLFKPIDLRSWNRRNIFFYAFLCFWFATVNHSSMRIAAPAFIYALTLLNVTYDKRPLHRKQAAQLKA
ncbi:MAG: O-antigen ligase family protein, partial [Psychroserpens sp.]|nr:O-antigen ligase family protein [Psychroserpens sp.]